MSFVHLLYTVALAAPIQVPVHGAVSDAAGNPLEGTHLVDLTLHNAASGGAILHEESAMVSFSRGSFSVVLGGAAAQLQHTAFAGAAWLSIRVDDGEPSARTRIGEAPRAAVALFAEEAAHAADADAADLAANASALGGIPAANFYHTGSSIPWSKLDTATMPARIRDGYTPGAGLTLSGTEFALDPSAVTALAYDSRSEIDALIAVNTTTATRLYDLLDGRYIQGSGGGGGVITLGDTTQACTAALFGTLRWNDTADRFEGCTPSGWTPLGRGDPVSFGAGVAGDGLGSATAGGSCSAIKYAFPSSNDGTYWIKPNANEAAFQVFCDMTTDGGPSWA